MNKYFYISSDRFCLFDLIYCSSQELLVSINLAINFNLLNSSLMSV